MKRVFFILFFLFSITLYVMSSCVTDDKERDFVTPQCTTASPKTFLAKVTATADSTLLIVDHYGMKYDEQLHSLPQDIFLQVGSKVLPLLSVSGYYEDAQREQGKPFCTRVSLRFAALPAGTEIISLYTTDETKSWINISNIKLQRPFVNNAPIECRIKGRVECPLATYGFFILRHNTDPLIQEHQYVPILDCGFEYTLRVPEEELYNLASTYEFLSVGHWAINEFVAENDEVECRFVAPHPQLAAFNDYEFEVDGGEVNSTFNALYEHADKESGITLLEEQMMKLLAQGATPDDSTMIALNDKYIVAHRESRNILRRILHDDGTVAGLLALEKELMSDINKARMSGNVDEALFDEYKRIFSESYADRFSHHAVGMRIMDTFIAQPWREYTPPCGIPQ